MAVTTIAVKLTDLKVIWWGGEMPHATMPRAT
jgi:hypothetical protein